MKYRSVFLSLGSNLGDRQANLQSALNRIDDSPSMSVRHVSSVFETAPLYNPDQDNFYNITAEIETDLQPTELIDALKQIEADGGRNLSAKRYSPREIDIDIIFFGDIVLESEKLTIPHCFLYERSFVLTPLNELNGRFVDPATGKDVRQLLSECPDRTSVQRIGTMNIPKSEYITEA
ncbi:MAG: 2-amino-4-hydroxy-6-hydroxymethyldihydropteridine diphosphokinase [Candidatus Neomarinimicrobiota bacterium]